ncbi:MAG: hybrid sensor histidine kinase/response regulator [Thermoanaerobaculia bacterium]|nr:hybrid sensor histidine kinase/response regulator [Thermoanaerobaculia bacterium]
MNALDALFAEEVGREAVALKAALSSESPFDAGIIFAAQAIHGAAKVVGAEAAVRLSGGLEGALLAVESRGGTLSFSDVETCRAAVELIGRLAARGAEEGEQIARERRSEVESLVAALEAMTAQGISQTAQPDRAEPVATDALAEVTPVSLELFRHEAELHTATLTDGLLVLEKEPRRLEVVERLMRAAHSIKGAARVVGLEAAVRLAHAAEDQLIRIQTGSAEVSPVRIEMLLEASDMLGRLANAVLAPAGSRPSDREVLALAARLAAGEGGAGPAPGRPDAEAGARAAETPVPAEGHSGAFAADLEEDRVLRVRASHLSRLVALAGESLVETRRLKPFAEVQQRLRARQAGLADLLNDLHQALGAPASDHPIGMRIAELRQRLSEARSVVSTWVEEFEEHARRSEDLMLRLFREATGSRMRPLSDGLTAFPRLVRDVARKLGKLVDLHVTGEDQRIDRDILERIEAPLNHLIRNAVDHGLEPPDVRRASGKPERGTIRLEARHRFGMLEISVSDDGSGIDLGRIRERVQTLGLLPAETVGALDEDRLLDHLFAPGFSTAEHVSEISGRGVGLDVVRSVLREVGGAVWVTTEAGRGTSFHLRVPVSRSVLRAVVVKIADEPYAFPLNRIDALLRVPLGSVQQVEDRQYVPLDGRAVALVPASQILELEAGGVPSDPLHIVLLSDRGHSFGFAVQEFLGEFDLVVRPLDPRLGRVADISAAAILPDGTPVLIIDVEDIVRSVLHLRQETRMEKLGISREPPARRKKRILVVDDSITVRELQRELLSAKGYEVETAVDGEEGWMAARDRALDLVITDIDMPRMDGVSLTRSIKQDPRLKGLPVIIVSYRGSVEDRLRGLSAAADLYLPKSDYADEKLLQAVADLIGAPEE